MKNKRAELAWQRITSDEKFQNEVTRIRKKFKIPIDGHVREYYHSYQALDRLFEDYLTGTSSKGKLGIQSYSPSDKEWARYYKFIEETRKLSNYSFNLADFKTMNISKPKIGLVVASRFYFGESDLEKIIEEYILYSKTNSEALQDMNTTGCDYFLITDENRKEEHKLTNGFYIRIGAHSTQTDIDLFFKQNKEEMLMWQKFFAKRENNPRKNTKHKTSTTIKRDKMILELNKKPIEELQLQSGSISRSKDILISIIMGKEGMPTSPENVRVILGRRKNLAL